MLVDIIIGFQDLREIDVFVDTLAYTLVKHDANILMFYAKTHKGGSHKLVSNTAKGISLCVSEF